MIVDTGGSIISVNQAFEAITGYAKDEVIGKSCSVLQCSLFEAVRRPSGKQWCKLFETGENETTSLYPWSIKTGMSSRTLKNASILYDSSGELMGGCGDHRRYHRTGWKKTTRSLRSARSCGRRTDSMASSVLPPPWKKTFFLLENAARSDAPVMLYGESGTGKELVANAIHEIGERRDGPLCTGSTALH